MATAHSMVVLTCILVEAASSPIGRERAGMAPARAGADANAFDLLRFPSFSAKPAHRDDCFYNEKYSKFAINVPPAAAWPAGAGALNGCATPGRAVTLAGAGGRSPHEDCVTSANDHSASLEGADELLGEVYRDVAQFQYHPREPRARTSIDLALGATIRALHQAGHNLVVETEYALGGARRRGQTPMVVPGDAARGENWVSGYPGTCKPALAELWGSPDYVVLDGNNRIVMVLEAKRLGDADGTAAAQMAMEALAAAATNYWGERGEAARMASVSAPRPSAGAHQHVAGVVTDGVSCMSTVLCGGKLNGNAVRRLPFGGYRLAPRTARPFDDIVSCTLYALTQALHGGPCA